MENKRRNRRRKIADDIKEESKPRPRKKRDQIDPERLLPTGSLLFNCALSDHVEGGFQMGKMANVIGDSSSGKTFLCLSAFAEACQLPRFDDYKLIYDDTEEADEFDLSKLFGKRAADRIQPPDTDEDGLPVMSNTIQEFWDIITDHLEEKKPFIYVLDSFDGLDDEADQKKVKEQKTARRKGNEVKGTYGMSKAKVASSMFKDIIPKLKATGSILIIISQTRDNIDPMSFAKKTRSGGNALKFYATHEVWLANAGVIKKKDQDIGNNVKAKVSKNKLTGKHRIVKFPIFYDYGVDSIRASVEFITDEGYWEKKKATIIAEDLDLKGTPVKLIELIEDGDREDDLAKVVQRVWNIREDELKLNRKSKYR